MHTEAKFTVPSTSLEISCTSCKYKPESGLADKVHNNKCYALIISNVSQKYFLHTHSTMRAMLLHPHTLVPSLNGCHNQV